MIKKGDTIGIIALGGNCDKLLVEKATQNIETLGYKVRLSKNIYDQNNYLAGTDEGKIEELHSFFQNSEIKLILNARGGYGSIRLINKINYNIIKANPKPFCGFSDITALLLMIYKKCGLITYHGPMACSDFVDPNAYTIKNFINTLNGKTINLTCNRIYKAGVAKGILWGGNLSTIVSLCGQEFIPDEDFIFFAEDLNEPVYKIDKMFTQLFNIKKFKKNCKAIVIGEFLEVDNKEWLEDLFKTFNIPTVEFLKLTHSIEKITLPIGKIVKLDKTTLEF